MNFFAVLAHTGLVTLRRNGGLNMLSFLRRSAAFLSVISVLFLLFCPLMNEFIKVPLVQTVDGMDPPSHKYIALTFDDGPRRKTTTRLLDGLAARGVHASFFLIGELVDGREDIVQRMHAEGHQIGLHTNTHIILSNLSRAKFDHEIGGNRAILEEIVGKEAFMIRPPFGITDAAVRSWVNAPLIRWSIDTLDWKDQNCPRIVSVVCKEARDGAIILMHDIYSTSVDAALEIVDRLMAEGYLFVTMEQLFALRGVVPKPGVLYDKLPPLP
ncbi:MAG: polysaccharide deacetylase family protein [Evtepia sp.]